MDDSLMHTGETEAINLDTTLIGRVWFNSWPMASRLKCAWKAAATSGQLASLETREKAVAWLVTRHEQAVARSAA